MKALTKADSEFENYTDAIKPYVGGYDARNVPYWVLIENSQVVGIVVVGEEPLKVIEPLGTTVSVVLVVDFDQPSNVMNEFVAEAVRIAKEQNAAYSFVDFPDKYTDLVSTFLNNGYTEIAHSLKMMCKLDGDYDEELSLRFVQIERDEVQNFLNSLKVFMSGSPDVMLDIVLSNLGEFPEQFLDQWFKAEQLYYAYDGDEIVGILDLSPGSYFSIANIGTSPDHRGKGYGRQMMLYGFNLLKEMGKETVGLRVHADNKVAKGLYESMGFTVKESQKALIWRK